MVPSVLTLRFTAPNCIPSISSTVISPPVALKSAASAKSCNAALSNWISDVPAFRLVSPPTVTASPAVSVIVSPVQTDKSPVVVTTPSRIPFTSSTVTFAPFALKLAASEKSCAPTLSSTIFEVPASRVVSPTTMTASPGVSVMSPPAVSVKSPSPLTTVPSVFVAVVTAPNWIPSTSTTSISPPLALKLSVSEKSCNATLSSSISEAPASSVVSPPTVTASPAVSVIVSPVQTAKSSVAVTTPSWIPSTSSTVTFAAVALKLSASAKSCVSVLSNTISELPAFSVVSPTTVTASPAVSVMSPPAFTAKSFVVVTIPS